MKPNFGKIVFIFTFLFYFSSFSFSQDEVLVSKQFYYESLPILVNLIVENEKKGEELALNVFETITNYMFNYSYEGGSYLSNITYKAYRGFVSCDEDLLKILGITLDYYYATKGAISPTIGSLIELWGFGKNPNVPTKEEIEYALKASSPKNLVIHQGSIRLKSKSTKFYLKPFAIGLALEKVKEKLDEQKVKNAIVTVDTRYSLVLGKKFNSDWVIGVKNPLAMGISEFVYSFSVSDRFVSVSSVDEDRFNIDFKNYFSIIDPRTGYPPDSKVVSVVVVGKNSVDSVVLSRVLLTLGDVGGPKFAESRNVAALFVVSEGVRFNFIKTKRWVELVDKHTQDKQKKIKTR